MSLRTTVQFRNPDRSGTFNMTPIIDIVFLLIIFFLVVCQFIEAENFRLPSPTAASLPKASRSPEPR